MFGRSWLLGAGGLALLCVIGAPGPLSAQGRFRSPGLPSGGRPAPISRLGPTAGFPVGGASFGRGRGRWSAWSGRGRGASNHWRHHGRHHHHHHHPHHAGWGRRR